MMAKNECYVLYRTNHVKEISISVYKEKINCYNRMYKEIAEEADDLSASGYLYQTESDISGGKVTANNKQIYYQWNVYASVLN